MNTLNINKEYKEKFEYEQRRKILDQVKEKYGKNLITPSSSSASVSEDSDCEYINPKVFDKYVDLLAKLKDSNKKKELLKSKDKIFTEDDFNFEKVPKKKEKIYTVKDAVIDSVRIEGDDEENFESINYIPKIKNDKFREDFIKAATIDKSNDINKNFVDDGFLT